MRTEVLHSVRRIGEADVAGHFAVVRAGKGIRIAGMVVLGVDRDAVDRAYGVHGEKFAAAVGDVADIFLNPPRSWTRKFLRTEDAFDREQFEQTAIYRSVMTRVGVDDQLRLYATHGERFLGYVGALRRRGDARFSRADAARIQPYVSWVASALGAADALEHERLPGESAWLVVCPAGEVQFATSTAAAWLDRPGFRAALHDVVRGWDACSPVESCDILDRAEARVTRMDYEGRVRYLVQVRCAEAPRFSGASLSPTQRLISEYAASGATVPETAAALERSFRPCGPISPPCTAVSVLPRAWSWLGRCRTSLPHAAMRRSRSSGDPDRLTFRTRSELCLSVTQASGRHSPMRNASTAFQVGPASSMESACPLPGTT